MYCSFLSSKYWDYFEMIEQIVWIRVRKSSKNATVVDFYGTILNHHKQQEKQTDASVQHQDQTIIHKNIIIIYICNIHLITL